MTLLTPKNAAYSAINTKEKALSLIKNHRNAFNNLLLLLAVGCNKQFASIEVYDLQGDSICFTNSIDNEPLQASIEVDNLFGAASDTQNSAALEKKI